MTISTKDLCFSIFVLFFHVFTFGQPNLLLDKSPDSIPAVQLNKPSFKNERIKPISFIIPASMAAYGVWAVNNDYLKKFDRRVNEQVYLNRPHPPLRIDNILRYSPAAVAFGLNALGIKGKHKMMDAGIIYLMSNAIMSGAVISLKNTTPILRPDQSANNSFPSGHTAAAFVSAEFLLREYIDVSPWIGIAGYGAAVLTGYLRLYNNKHWFSDVMAGAGIGVISTKLSYVIYNEIQPRLLKNKGKNTLIMPAYQNGSWGVQMVKTLK